MDVQFGGSVAKHTYVDGISDVDSLVLLDNCELADGDPGRAQKYFLDRLKERFPNTTISAGRLAVTISFSDAEIQLLPAISCEGNVKIANSSGTGWSEIRPRAFADALSQANKDLAGKLIPTVKLAKGIVSALPEKQRISGYHAEALAVEIFSGYSGELQARQLLQYYFTEAGRRVQTPMTDRTGQSMHVDEYLGPPSSIERRVVGDAFGRIARRMTNAASSHNLDEWRRLFGDPDE